LLPLFSKSSSILGKYWIQVLKDYSYICLCLNLKKNVSNIFFYGVLTVFLVCVCMCKRNVLSNPFLQWNPFLDGIQSPLVSSKLRPIFKEAWPVILQAIALDAVPGNFDGNSSLISGYSMVELEIEEYRFLWGFALLILFQQQHTALTRQIIPLNSSKVRYGGD